MALKIPISDTVTYAAPVRLTAVQWVICAVACLGFAFDTYEITVLPLVVRPAITELGGLQTGTPEFNRWVGLTFFVPFVAGGLFGLLGGYLTDRFGRRRVRILPGLPVWPDRGLLAAGAGTGTTA